MKVDLLDLLGIRSVKPMWYVRFDTRRKLEGESFEETKFKRIIEDKYVCEIAPMTLMDQGQIRFSRIYREINEVHIPLLESDETERKIDLVRGIYKREKIYHFGKQIGDVVNVENKIKSPDGTWSKYEIKQ